MIHQHPNYSTGVERTTTNMFAWNTWTKMRYVAYFPDSSKKEPQPPTFVWIPAKAWNINGYGDVSASPIKTIKIRSEGLPL